MAPRDDDAGEIKTDVADLLDHRASTSSRASSQLSHGRDRFSLRSSRTSSNAPQHHSHNHHNHHHHNHHLLRDNSSTVGAETTPPRILSSPSVASSFGQSASSVLSPLRKELDLQRASGGGHGHGHGIGIGIGISASASASSASEMDSVRAGKQELAKRLSLLAQRLTYGDSMEELVALDLQVNQIEQALGGGIGAGIGASGLMGRPLSPHKDPRRRPMNYQTPLRHSRSDLENGLLGFSSPESSLHRTHYSDMSASLPRHRHEDFEEEEQPPPKKGMTAQQANKVISEMIKLNEELATVVQNLQARQEESDHIHKLLIERAERAAQRIIFLQNRITYLEQELQENDHELQHLRVGLKQVEIQMPRHPDHELQRCFTVIKEDYQALKRKRAHRSTMVSFLGYDQAIAASSPTKMR
ncbi:hypothetical protein ESCO_001312 [Escovopsis weberi]|uniref:Uncharacterized protein n=1 Tax=Escovopsis weberi TaxID=150374 RepID=A0A0M8N2P3_ESCWE|nr:hypothetical protein ESCO_001312 [Escovopsis weberi]